MSSPKTSTSWRAGVSPQRALLQALLLFAAAIATVLGACSGDDCADVLVDGVCQKPCQDSECVEGARCYNNACSPSCSAQGDCGSGRYCLLLQFVDGTIGNYCICTGAVVDGVCRQNSCNEASCPPGFRCIENSCSAPCTTHNDCPVGKNCLLAGFPQPDGSVLQATFCATPGFARDGSAGQETPCSQDADCDSGRGWRCLGGGCHVPCATHPDCGRFGSCSGSGADAAGNLVHFCAQDGKPRGPGQYGTACPTGEECDESTGFACVGAGAGDLDAYCTESRCSGDVDCPSGYECATVRSGRPPCENTCSGVPAVPGDERCVPADQIGQDREFSCGPLSLLRKLCLLRDFCSACESDADCIGKPNRICARDASGAKICTVPCDPGINSCPWGFAGVCDVWDAQLGIPTCSHRFGSCSGTGKSCEPCVDDADCGTNGLCLNTPFTHERFCIDLNTTCNACPSGTATCLGNGCPLTPGGLAMTCYGGVAAQEPLSRKCVGANVNENPVLSPQIGCWPAP